MTRLVYVNEKPYEVRERGGILKASMNGFFGWASVWLDAETPKPYEAMVLKIKRVLAFGPMENRQ
jgi:hypothetical protein